MGSSYFRKRPLTIPQQVFRMSGDWPGFNLKLKPGVGVWTGAVQPTPLSETYQVQIRYALGTRPKITVLSPTLRKNAKGEKIPHRYHDGSLCLYQPKYGEWTPQLFIADTILPWTSLWLAHYEYWLATGEWHGGGEHPDN